MKKLSLKAFEEQYRPLKQVTDRTYKKYFIYNDDRASTHSKISKIYNCNIFTGIIKDKTMTLLAGKRFSLKDSFFIVCEEPWDEENIKLVVELSKKQK